MLNSDIKRFTWIKINFLLGRIKDQASTQKASFMQ